MLQIHIEDLTFDCIIGILPFERVNTQKVIVNISFEYFYDNGKNEFVDYSEVVSLVETTIKEKQFQLIEDAILYIKEILLKQFNIQNLKIKISKPDILKNCTVSISTKITTKD